MDFIELVKFGPQFFVVVVAVAAVMLSPINYLQNEIEFLILICESRGVFRLMQN